jgi:diguanylate cyclase (GGDEF)-like protein/PAS domain S-box-containing protein
MDIEHMTRILGRGSAPRLPVTLVALATLGWVVLLLSTTGHQAQLVSNVGLVVSALGASIAAIRRSRLSPGAMRRFWFLLGAAAGSWAGGQAVWTWYESILGREVPFPSLADVGYLAMPVFATAALLSLPLAAPTLAGRVRTILDGLAVAASLLVCSWLLVLESVFRAGNGLGPLTQAISLTYPSSDIVLITIVVCTALQVRRHGGSQLVSLPLVGTGLVAFAVADSGFSYLTAEDAYHSGNGIDIGWFMGYVLILLAALRPGAQHHVTAIDEDKGLATRPLGALLPSTAVMLALLTTAVAILRTGHTDPLVSGVWSLILMLLVVRQVLALRENRYLTEHLEQRVDERTSELATSRERFAALVQHSSEVVTVVDDHARVQYQSPSSAGLLGLLPSQIEGTSLCDIMTPAGATDFQLALDDVATQPLGVHSMRSTWQHADGGTRDVELTITNLLDNPHVGGLVLNSRDVTDRTMLEAQLLHQAFHDSLTGLANRALFRDRLERALECDCDGGDVTIMFLDLDGFKEVNDTLGHSAGDELLVLVSSRLRRELRARDLVARCGGDEFAILVDDPPSAPLLADRIGVVLEQPFAFGAHLVHVSASIGIATTGVETTTAEQLLRNADLAMYQAKAAGGASFAVYNQTMHASLVERLQTESDLRSALEQDEFVVHYQPLIDLESGQIRGAEALVRWLHPRRGLIQPDSFIPLAESSGLIQRLGLWVLRASCEQTMAWHRSSPEMRELTISVNVSAQQLPDPGLFAWVRDILADTGLHPSFLTLEMTESGLLDDSEDIRFNLMALHDIGVRLAIDDFGTGYSSLSYLHRFPVDILKIDRSFIQQLSSSGEVGLISTIIRLGQTMQLETVAEGIEHAEEMLILRGQGCTTGQGFHFSRPVSAAQLTALLHAQKPSFDARAGGSTRLVP